MDGKPWETLPWYFHRVDGEPVIFAELLATGQDDVETMAIITEAVRGKAKAIHDQLPLVLTPDRISS
ncbi:hypothetical protein GM160_04165 [Guyparkeria halophila]|uniref:Uncharacterized protein n=1 Tax=Guyparkeria halophila TaxID=47960 RepID=A0A6I6D3I4_9GAMM|nr:hypothetical protein GM160_04165 [Guyparkeria halophila]